MYALWYAGQLVERMYGVVADALLLRPAAIAASAPATPSAGRLERRRIGGDLRAVRRRAGGTRFHHAILDAQSRAIASQIGVLIVLNLVIGFSGLFQRRQLRPRRRARRRAVARAVLPPGQVPTLGSIWQSPAEAAGRGSTLALRVVGVAALVAVVVAGFVVRHRQVAGGAGLPLLHEPVPPSVQLDVRRQRSAVVVTTPSQAERRGRAGRRLRLPGSDRSSRQPKRSSTRYMFRRLSRDRSGGQATSSRSSGSSSRTARRGAGTSIAIAPAPAAGRRRLPRARPPRARPPRLRLVAGSSASAVRRSSGSSPARRRRVHQTSSQAGVTKCSSSGPSASSRSGGRPASRLEHGRPALAARPSGASAGRPKRPGSSDGDAESPGRGHVRVVQRGGQRGQGVAGRPGRGVGQEHELAGRAAQADVQRGRVAQARRGPEHLDSRPPIGGRSGGAGREGRLLGVARVVGDDHDLGPGRGMGAQAARSRETRSGASDATTTTVQGASAGSSSSDGTAAAEP